MAPDKTGQGRVAVETGIEAYQITGARPTQGAFARFTRPERPEGTGRAVLEAACGIGVLVEAGLISRLAGERHYEAARRELGRPYAEGFAHGFDGAPMPRELWSHGPDRERMIEGHRDGRTLWAAVRDGVPSPVPDFPPTGWAPETTSNGTPVALQK